MYNNAINKTTRQQNNTNVILFIDVILQISSPLTICETLVVEIFPK